MSRQMGAGQNPSFALVGTARCAVRTPQRGVPTSEEFCRASPPDRIPSPQFQMKNR